MGHVLAAAAFVPGTLLARGPDWASAGLENNPEIMALTHSMVLAAGVLIATLVIVVGTAVVWHVASDKRDPEAGGDPKNGHRC